MTNSLLADIVLALHLVYVGFVIFGYLATIAGGLLGWGWVRGRVFRLGHLAAIGFVAFEATIGMVCPLTGIENAVPTWASHHHDLGRENVARVSVLIRIPPAIGYGHFGNVVRQRRCKVVGVEDHGQLRHVVQHGLACGRSSDIVR